MRSGGMGSRFKIESIRKVPGARQTFAVSVGGIFDCDILVGVTAKRLKNAKHYFDVRRVSLACSACTVLIRSTPAC